MNPLPPIKMINQFRDTPILQLNTQMKKNARILSTGKVSICTDQVSIYTDQFSTCIDQVIISNDQVSVNARTRTFHRTLYWRTRSVRLKDESISAAYLRSYQKSALQKSAIATSRVCYVYMYVSVGLSEDYT